MTEIQQTSSATLDTWRDDVLDRSKLAEFLSKSLAAQANERSKLGQTGLTVALDADWGAGKSFFVRRWAMDLANAGHPVVVFDAWENDIGDEAAVALMATIKAELDSWTDKLPKGRKVRQMAKQSTESAIKGLRRAIAPASKAIASGLIKKATGIAVNEVLDAISGNEKSDVLESANSGAASALEAGLDKLFERSLEEHHKRSHAISQFKSSIGSLIDLLEQSAGAELPVFVFVDEVDRCRPTYAIKLLEEIKHIFGVPKIVFVLSTNLDQLRESVCGIYGNGFNGHIYLKRFFDYHYTLPEPNNEAFSRLLLNDATTFASRRFALGLPATDADASVHRVMGLIATAFGLDLRSQKQVFQMTVAASATIPNDKRIFVFWLLFLCALKHKAPALFDQLISSHVDHKKFSEICGKALSKDVEIEYLARQNSYDRNPDRRHAKLSIVAWNYYSWALQPLQALHETHSRTNTYEYPGVNLSSVAEELPSPYNAAVNYTPSINRYPEITKYAGLMISE